MMPTNTPAPSAVAMTITAGASAVSALAGHHECSQTHCRRASFRFRESSARDGPGCRRRGGDDAAVNDLTQQWRVQRGRRPDQHRTFTLRCACSVASSVGPGVVGFGKLRDGHRKQGNMSGDSPAAVDESPSAPARPRNAVPMTEQNFRLHCRRPESSLRHEYRPT